MIADLYWLYYLILIPLFPTAIGIRQIMDNGRAYVHIFLKVFLLGGFFVADS